MSKKNKNNEEIMDENLEDLEEEGEKSNEDTKLDAEEDVEAALSEEDMDTSHEYVDLQERYNKLEDTYKRMLADFENSKRHAAQEVLDSKNAGKIEVFEKILDIVDNFQRSLEYDTNTEEFRQGIKMLSNMFNDRLKSLGLEEVRHEGELDPGLHQAIAIEEQDDLEDNEIIEVLQKGYRVEGKVIRPAMVKVNKKSK